MKKIAQILALSLMAVGASLAEPVNKTCPLSGKDIDASVTSTHKGETVAFCCEKCKAKFDADPAKYEGKIKKD